MPAFKLQLYNCVDVIQAESLTYVLSSQTLLEIRYLKLMSLDCYVYIQIGSSFKDRNNILVNSINLKIEYFILLLISFQLQ